MISDDSLFLRRNLAVTRHHLHILFLLLIYNNFFIFESKFDVAQAVLWFACFWWLGEGPEKMARVGNVPCIRWSSHARPFRPLIHSYYDTTPLRR